MTNDEVFELYSTLFKDDSVRSGPYKYGWYGFDIENVDGLWHLSHTVITYSYDSGPDCELVELGESPHLDKVLAQAAHCILSQKLENIGRQIGEREEADRGVLSHVMEEDQEIPF